jgi:two-component system, NtrC family, sensor kinase
MRPRVLVVDDSLTVRMDISEALEAAGLDAVPCTDLRSAREATVRESPALIVLDVRLPDGDGLDFLEELRGARATERIPVLLLSTEAEVKSRVRGMSAGADEYVGKPYDIGQVVARARDLVRSVSNDSRILRRRVLVIDDSPTFRRELRNVLEGAGYEVFEVETGEEGLAAAASIRPDALIVDGILPGIDGATVVRRLKSDAALRRTPCLLFTGQEEASDELRALEEGADAYLRKSEDLDLVLVKLSALLRGASASGGEPSPSLFGPKRLLAVDDSITYLDQLGSQLREEGYDVVLAKSGEEALELLSAQPVDCILLDLIMPGLSGQETCRKIKESQRWRDIPLVMLTAHDSRDSMIEGINAGADDYIAKSADFDVLKARLRAQLRRKHFEDENRRIREQLVRKETEARFQRLIHSNIIGVIMSDLSGHLSDANDAFLQMLGYTRSELEAGLLRADLITPEESRERDAHAVSQLRQSGSATPYEKEFLRKDGTRLSAVLGLVLLEGATTAVGFVLDRTEQKVAEERVRKYSIALEEANRELESFSYSVAHDLRAPLRSIRGFGQALLEDCEAKLDDEGRKYLGFIRESAERMEQLIEDLLELSRVTKKELARERLDLSELARASVARLERAHPRRQVNVTIQEGMIAHGDSRLLAIVFDNLIGNAWKFTSKSEPARIEVGAELVDGQKTYYVRDNGAGFDMAFSHKLFGVFQRLHNASDFAGTGVGLATVQRIIRRHGGRVWAKGEIDRGAVFQFTLPEGGLSS